MSTSANQRYERPRVFENNRDGIIFDDEGDDYGLLTDQEMVKEQLGWDNGPAIRYVM